MLMLLDSSQLAQELVGTGPEIRTLTSWSYYESETDFAVLNSS